MILINGVETDVEIPFELSEPDRLDRFISGGESSSLEAHAFARLVAQHPVLGAERLRRRREFFDAYYASSARPIN